MLRKSPLTTYLAELQDIRGPGVKQPIGKQKEGKKRMKIVGSVEIPQEAFMAMLKLED